MDSAFDNVFEEPKEEKEPKEKRTHRRTVAIVERSKKNLYKRAYSESQLMDAVVINFKDGETYQGIRCLIKN